MIFEEREEQTECVKALWNEIQRTHSAFVWMATGSGKSAIFSKFIEKCHNLMKGQDRELKTLILVNKVKLATQHESRFLDFTKNINVGIFCGTENRFETDKDVLIATIQSLISKEFVPFVNLLIVDEAHRYHESKLYTELRKNLFKKNKKLKTAYFTATPYNTKKGGYIFRPDSNYFGVDKPCYIKLKKELIEKKRLVPIVLSEPDLKFDVQDLKVSAVTGDYTDKSVNDLVMKDKVKTKLQVKDALMRGKNRKKFVWSCVSIDHAELVEKELMSHGEKVFCIHSKKKETTNENYLEEFEFGSIRHLTSVVKISEGVDIPPIDCLPFLRPTKSPTLLEQVAGRGMRPFEDKKDCLFLDYGNVVQNLGHPLNPKINPRKRERMPSEIQLKTSVVLCPRCFEENFANASVCQHCGEKFPCPIQDGIYKNLRSKAFDPDRQYFVLYFQRLDHKTKSGAFMVKYKYRLKGRMLPAYQYFFKADHYHNDFLNALSRFEGKPKRVTLNEKGFVEKVFFK